MEKVKIFYNELFEYDIDEVQMEVKENMSQRFIFHYLFLGRIYDDFQILVGSWNNNGIRAEGSTVATAA